MIVLQHQCQSSNTIAEDGEFFLNCSRFGILNKYWTKWMNKSIVYIQNDNFNFYKPSTNNIHIPFSQHDISLMTRDFLLRREHLSRSDILNT